MTIQEYTNKLKQDWFVEEIALLLYLMQTDDERQEGKTIYLNQRGFNAVDGNTGWVLYFCRMINMGKTNKLKEEDYNDMRKLLIKYYSQVCTHQDLKNS